MSEKISVSMPREMLKELEEFMGKSSSGDRSRIIQLALKNFLDENKESEDFVYGVINVIYDFDEAEGDFTRVQHEHEMVIISNSHVHVSSKECMEAIFVKGKKSDILKLVMELNKVKGIKKVKPIFSYIGEYT